MRRLLRRLSARLDRWITEGSVWSRVLVVLVLAGVWALVCLAVGVWLLGLILEVT